MKNSQAFWEEAYNRCSPKLLAMCVRYVHDRELAEDLMHEGLAIAIDKYGTYSGRGSFEGWLRKIVVNTVLIHLRKNKQLVFIKLNEMDEFEMQGDEDDNENNERQIIEQAGFTQLDLRLLLFEIPDHYRIVFNLYVLEGYQHSEIASLLNIAVGTSKSNLARARKKIAELLYQEALEKKKDRKKTAVVLMSISMLFIDGLFKDAFAEQQITPKGMPEKLQLKIQSASIKSGSVSAIVSKLKIFLFGGVGLMVGSIVLFLLLKKPEVPKSLSVDVPKDSVTLKPIVSTPLPQAKKRHHSLTAAKKSNPPSDTILTVSKVPVIIKKQIIVRDTVFIKKRNDQ